MPHVACGFCVALVAEIWLPGQHVREYATAALLSLAGSIAGTALARGLFPGYLLKQGGYVLASCVACQNEHSGQAAIGKGDQYVPDIAPQ